MDTVLDRVPIGNCWIWTKSVRPNGYGRIFIKRRAFSIHRVSWQLHHGPIPGGMKVCHSCDVRNCFNPKHLFLGTHADNMGDMMGKGRSCRGTKNANRKLSESDVMEIRSRRSTGEKLESIAKSFGVSIPTANQAARGKTWKHLPPAVSIVDMRRSP